MGYEQKPSAGFTGVNIRPARTNIREGDTGRAVNVDFSRELGTASIRYGSTQQASLSETLVRNIAKVNSKRYYVAAQRLYRDGTEVSLHPQQLDSGRISDIDAMRPFNDDQTWAFIADVGNRKQRDPLGRGHTAMVKDNGTVTRKWGIAPPPDNLVTGPTIHVSDTQSKGKLSCGAYKWYLTHIRWTDPTDLSIAPAVAHEGNPVTRSATITTCADATGTALCPNTQELSVNPQYQISSASNRASWSYVGGDGVIYVLHGDQGCGAGNMPYDTCTTLTKFNADGTSSTATKVSPVDTTAAVNTACGHNDEHAYMFSSNPNHYYYSIDRNARIVMLSVNSTGGAAHSFVKRGDRIWLVDWVSGSQILAEYDITYTGLVKTALRTLNISSLASNNAVSLSATAGNLYLGIAGTSAIHKVSIGSFTVTANYNIPDSHLVRAIWAFNDDIIYFSERNSDGTLGIYALVRGSTVVGIDNSIPPGNPSSIWGVHSTTFANVLMIKGNAFFEGSAGSASGGNSNVKKMAFTCP